MIWINAGERSYQATAINVGVSKQEGKYALWAERTTGKTIEIFTGDAETAKEHKEAIDFAIGNGHKIYNL